MMTSLAQTHSPYPGGMQQHPGVPQGHPMAAMQHNPGQQIPGQPGMNPQMHMAGVSGPGGPQVSQAGAMMGGMPPGAGGPSAHALQHLNPQSQQAQIYQQQLAFANNGQLQAMQQQQMINHQRQQAARNAMIQQQYSGGVMPGAGMPNGMAQMTPGQYAAMRSGPMARPAVNLPQHLQQQQAQAQAQHTLEQQQAQQHQAHILQQMAMQQQHAQAQASNNQGQQGQMNPQQLQNMHQAQIAAQHQAQQAQAQAVAQQQNQGPSQSQAVSQAPPSTNAQAQPQQPQPQAQQQPNMQQQQAAVMAALSQQHQQRQGDRLKGQCLMRLMQFGDHLSGFRVSSRPLSAYIERGAQRSVAQTNKQRDDLTYWQRFVDQFFSPKGVLRHGVWIDGEDQSNKQYEIPFHALARYFHTHFESGIKNMQMIMERGSEKELPNNGHYIESQKSSFVYWFDNGAQLIANGTLKAHFDAEQKIELFEFVTSSHDEYLLRSKIIDAARPLHDWSKEWKGLNSLPDGKQSPEMNKKKAKAMKSPQQPPPEIDLPASKVKQSMGITPSVFRFLELAEVLGQMNPLFHYSHQNAHLAPYAALDQYVATQTVNGSNPNGQQNPPGPRTPGLSNFPLGTSPATAHLQLPDGSPHISGSPAQAPGMQLQQSQHGTSSSGPSANTSPNASNKRRRPSTVKAEEESQVNGTGLPKAAVKPSPRIGGKRQKGNPA